MSASVTMEVVTTTVITQMEVTYVPAIMATGLTVMDKLVKVDKILCASKIYERRPVCFVSYNLGVYGVYECLD